jgi:hypothetical protein
MRTMKKIFLRIFAAASSVFFFFICVLIWVAEFNENIRGASISVFLMSLLCGIVLLKYAIDGKIRKNSSSVMSQK